MRILSVICPVLVLYTINAVLSYELYSSRGPVYVLDALNFTEVVYHKSYSWLVAFYAHWCGHCHHFAPIWRDFSSDIKAWRRIIRPAALDCAVKKNEKLCLQYKIEAFPTVVLFKWQSGEETVPIIQHLGSDQNVILKKTIDLVENMGLAQDLYHPNPIQSADDIPQELARRHPSSSYTGLVGLVEENAQSYVGRGLMLDFESMSNVEIFRVVIETKEAPSFYISVHNKRPLEKVAINATMRNARQLFHAYVYERLGLTASTTLAPELPKPPLESVVERNGKATKELAKRAHQRDIDSALHYSLSHDVVMKSDFSSEALDSLKQFVDVLIKYYPATGNVTKFLETSRDWLSRRSELTGQQWSEFLTNSQTAEAHLVENTGEQWSGCLGSEPHYRGYPCGLWTMFHTLTAQAYRKSLVDPTTYDARQVLVAMVTYITNFFSCRECGVNFRTETEGFERSVKTSQDVVLYLWRVHNNVNKRLRTDESADPLAPKIEFPSPMQCPKCRLRENGEDVANFRSRWNAKEVLTFLLNFYLPINLVHDSRPSQFETKRVPQQQQQQQQHQPQQQQQQTTPRLHERTRETKDNKRSVMRRKIDELYRKKLSAVDTNGRVQYLKDREHDTRRQLVSRVADRFSSADLSLCAFFYLLCVLLLLAVYLKITTRKGGKYVVTHVC